MMKLWCLLFVMFFSVSAWSLDTDLDTIEDGADNCTHVANLDQADTDADGLGDACDDNPLANTLDIYVRYWAGLSVVDGLTVDLARTGGEKITTSTLDAEGNSTVVRTVEDEIEVTIDGASGIPSGTRPITSADALAALKIAVGLNPNASGDDVSPFQLLAADYNQDGRVTSADALAILKQSVGLNDAQPPQWRYVDDAEALSGFDKNNVPALKNVKSIEAGAASRKLYSAVLLGDVNGSLGLELPRVPLALFDFDLDGSANSFDVDDDNDGVADIDDAFPFDQDESLDTDLDGLGNNADQDDDNDGLADADDASPLGLNETRHTFSIMEDNWLYDSSLVSDEEVIAVFLPQEGLLELDKFGYFQYLPKANFYGNDVFQLLRGSEYHVISIEITPVFDGIFVRDTWEQVDEDQILTGILDISNPDNLDYTLSLANQPSNGTITLKENNTFEYQPTKNFYGNDGFLVDVAADGVSGLNVAVNITVNYVSDGVGIWTNEHKQFWTGQELEGAISYCDKGTQRWISPITQFDANKDALNDILIPISCYQELLTRDEIESRKQHNNRVFAAWKMMCSDANTDTYIDCTRQKFGTDVINVTGTEYGGGNPYIHVMDTPRDLNGDGYPEFVYALNRDDGRPGFMYPQDDALIQELCPNTPPDIWDCTRTTVQSMLLSKDDGTYEIVFAPWGITNTQAIMILPNNHGTFDLMAFNYGQWRAARLVERTLVDVTDEYRNYINIDYVGFTSPYNTSFVHEEATYAVTPNIPASLALNSEATIFSQQDLGWSADQQDQYKVSGFSLWRFEPGVGFILSDYYTPPVNDLFYYQDGTSESFYTSFGFYFNGIAVFQPRWHFFEYAQLSTDEAPMLITNLEGNGTLPGPYLRNTIDPSAFYSFDSADPAFRVTAGSIFQGFYIVNGKLVQRSKSIIDGHFAFNAPGFKFEDVDQDGDLDMYTIDGGTDQSDIYKNIDGTQFLVDIEDSLPPFVFSTPSTSHVSWAIRSMGRPKKVELLYWGSGNTYPEFDPETLEVNYQPTDFGIYKAQVDFDLLPLMPFEKLIEKVGNCFIYNGHYCFGL